MARAFEKPHGPHHPVPLRLLSPATRAPMSGLPLGLWVGGVVSMGPLNMWWCDTLLMPLSLSLSVIIYLVFVHCFHRDWISWTLARLKRPLSVHTKDKVKPFFPTKEADRLVFLLELCTQIYVWFDVLSYAYYVVNTTSAEEMREPYGFCCRWIWSKMIF